MTHVQELSSSKPQKTDAFGVHPAPGDSELRGRNQVSSTGTVFLHL